MVATDPSSLREKALLVRVHLRLWSARRVDELATQEIHRLNGAGSNAGAYSKRLFPADPPSLKALTSLRNDLSKAFRAMTLPWADGSEDGGRSDDARRLLPTANWPKYSDLCREYGMKVEACKLDFFQEYSTLVMQAQQDLQGLWRPEDYPDLETLDRKIQLRVATPEPLPGGDFRVSLSSAEREQIRERLEADLLKKMASSAQDAWKRLHGPLQHMAHKLQGAGVPCPCPACLGKAGKSDSFHESLVDNLRGILEALPSLNILQDPALEAAMQQVAGLLDPAGAPAVTAQRLRDSEELKTSVQAKAMEISNNMAGLMARWEDEE